MLAEGERFGDYEVVTPIAHGGMSTVFRVSDTRDQSTWALKVLTIDQPGMIERFRAEAAMQASVDHEHIVAAREVIERDDKLGIVMEFVDGPSLDRWLQRHPSASFEERHALARQILVAVGVAHRSGLVHRDLKPGNVLIDGEIAKITDFGLAKQEGRPALTRTGIALGTPRYMAPEQFRDAKRVDHRADIFALGALLYELYAGRPAFQKDSIVDAYEALTLGDYVDPAVFGVPEDPCRAIRRALEPELDQRVPDCETFLAILDGASGSPPSPSPLRRPPPRHGRIRALPCRAGSWGWGSGRGCSR